MKVIEGDFQGKSVAVYKKFLGKYVLKAEGATFSLPDDLYKLKLLRKEEERSAFKMFLILLLGITIIGLIIAIPMLIASKNQEATLGVQTKSGKRFIFIADTQAWKILENFVGIGTMQEW